MMQKPPDGSALVAILAVSGYPGASTFGRTTGPLRSATAGRTFRLASPKIDQTGRLRHRAFVQRAYVSERDLPMDTGTVKWYNETKGYGFIQPDNGGKDVFVHATALERAGLRGLREGQKVSYELQTDQRNGKTSAVNLQAS
jgi:CspA family cold shock protein